MGLSRLLAIGGALAVLAPVPLAAQSFVSAARLVADLRADDGSAEVTIEYELTDESVAGDLTLELLGFEDATADDVVVDGGGRIVLWPANGSRRRATVSLPTDGSGGGRTISFSYRVSSAVVEEGGAIEARVPIVSLAVRPRTDAGDVFSARVRVPDRWTVSEGFPTGLRIGEDGTYEVSLPVVPSVVSLRGRTDGTSPLGLPLLIDLLAASILIAFATFGWRHLREVAS